MDSGTIGLMRLQRSGIWLSPIGRRASFGRDVIISFAGGVMARLVSLLSLPFVTRLYEPVDLGVWAIILTLATFVLPLATMRYDIAMVIAPTRRMAAALAATILVGLTIVSAIAAVAIFIAPHWLLETISGLGGESQRLLRLVPIVLALVAMQIVLQAWLTRERKFAALSLVQLVQALVTVSATLTLPFVFGASAQVASAAAVIGLGASIAVAARYSVSEMFLHSGRHIRVAAYASILRFKVYPLFVLPYALSAGLVERIQQIVLASAYSLSAVGAYYVARQLVLAPILMFSASLSRVIFAHSAANSDAERTKFVVDGTLRLLIDIQTAGLAFGLFWLKPILTVIMGPSWERLGDFAWWTLFPAAMLLLTGWLDRILDVFGRQRLSVILQLTSDAILIVLALLSPRLGFDESGMIAMLSLGVALYNLVWLGITLRILGFLGDEILKLFLRGSGFFLLWFALQFGVAKLLPGFLGLALASIILAAALVGPALKVMSRVRPSGAEES